MRANPHPEEPIRDRELPGLIREAQKGDERARRRVVQSNLGLVYKILKRFRGRGSDEEDLFQVGCMGLIRAVDKFDPERGVKFSTYAVPAIIGEIRHYLRDNQPLKTSRRLKSRAKRVLETKKDLSDELGREPTLSELESELELSREEIVQALEARKTPLSLERRVFTGSDPESPTLKDVIADEQRGDLEGRIDLREALSRLEDRELKIITGRFFAEKTQDELGEELGLSQVQVSRLERKTLEKIRSMLQGTVE